MLIIDIGHLSGIFTVPVSGSWRVVYSMRSHVQNGKENWAFLYLNGEALPESLYYTYSSSHTTGGRVLTLEANAGDTITLRMDGDYVRIIFCAEYIARMDSAHSTNLSSSSTVQIQSSTTTTTTTTTTIRNSLGKRLED